MAFAARVRYSAECPRFRAFRNLGILQTPHHNIHCPTPDKSATLKLSFSKPVDGLSRESRSVRQLKCVTASHDACG